MARNQRSISGPRLLSGLLLTACAFGQSGESTHVSVCQLLTDPARYSGKQVTIRAEVIEPRRVQLVDPGKEECGRIPWVSPTSPDVKPKPRFSLVQDAKLQELENSLGLMLPPPPGSTRQKSRVIAVLEGRFDSVYRLKHGKPVRSAQGIGYRGADEQVFVLHRVIKTEIVPDRSQDQREVPPKLP